ncbi:MAG: type IX secretion system membrane protein PorP/SprF [Bacteroidetes bacterium CHB5]|nr:type IX secretion system membrane protein PorP/SprF [Bacteroidetes bacterium CHB5]
MKKILLIVFGLMIGAEILAQDPQFSQYYQAPLYMNPGFTGITPQQRVAINHRIQWPNLPQAFSTYSASYDIFVDELRSGFGILATTDKMGSAGWRTTTVGLNYSYKVRLTNKVVFSPGLYFGYGINGLDRSRLRLGDGLEYDGISLDPELNKLGNQQYFDFGSGFIIYNRSLWVGASFTHMNTPNVSILNDVSRIPMKTTIHGGARITLMDGPREMDRASYLTPSFIYRKQGPISQLDFGLNYHIDPVSVGAWYRGKPFEKNVIGTVNQDALILTLGLYLKDFVVGYSYDFSISELSTSSGGAHEISIVYEFVAKPINRGVKKRNRLIPCPTFNTKKSFWSN